MSAAPHCNAMDDLDQNPLPEAPERYFKTIDTSTLIPLDLLVPDHLRIDAIPRAIGYMQAAYEGKGGKRVPISLRRREDGRYDIVDGNTTFYVAQKSGWKSIPATIEP